jgi:hypothetical protein
VKIFANYKKFSRKFEKENFRFKPNAKRVNSDITTQML